MKVGITAEIIKVIFFSGKGLSLFVLFVVDLLLLGMSDDTLYREEMLSLILDKVESTMMVILDELGMLFEGVSIEDKINSPLVCVEISGDEEQGTLANSIGSKA